MPHLTGGVDTGVAAAMRHPRDADHGCAGEAR